MRSDSLNGRLKEECLRDNAVADWTTIVERAKLKITIFALRRFALFASLVHLTINSYHTHTIMALSSWQEAAKKKREAVLALIPKAWVLPSISISKEERDVSGSYIEKYLNEQEKEITNTDAPEIVAKVANGVWTSVEVTEAFCHRAALAHQLVSTLEIIRKQKLGR
jgi:hypothetical protein